MVQSVLGLSEQKHTKTARRTSPGNSLKPIDQVSVPRSQVAVKCSERGQYDCKCRGQSLCFIHFWPVPLGERRMPLDIGLQTTKLLCPWDSPGKNTGVGCHFLLQGIFPTQGSNQGLLHCRQTLYPLSHQGSPCYTISQFSRSVVSDSLRPHASQHARSPCPSPTPGVHSNSRPSSW